MVAMIPNNLLELNCTTRQALELIADKWTILVIYALAHGTKRHMQLRREIAGISEKVLTQTLRRLEADGLIDRQVYPVVPPRVEYSLSELGLTLLQPLSALCEWAQRYMPEVEKIRVAQQ